MTRATNDKRIAQEVGHRAVWSLYAQMSPENRRRFRTWMWCAVEYRKLYPDAPMEEVRAAVRATKHLPLTPLAQFSARVTEQEAKAEHARICAEVHARFQEKKTA